MFLIQRDFLKNLIENIQQLIASKQLSLNLF